jgi:hypothetical protein
VDAAFVIIEKCGGKCEGLMSVVLKGVGRGSVEAVRCAGLICGREGMKVIEGLLREEEVEMVRERVVLGGGCL